VEDDREIRAKHIAEPPIRATPIPPIDSRAMEQCSSE
jgi:hypothetical protein